MPEILIKILVCLFASLFAGIGTGFVGMSAAVAITPILMAFLDVPHFEATAIALSSDVLASFIACVTYLRHKNTDIKNAILLMLTILVFTIGGTILGYYVPSNIMGYGTIFGIAFMGLKLIFFPSKRKENNKEVSKKKQIWISLGFGAGIGFVCGFVGAGGGMMILLCLTVFLKYDMHKAVGTSLFIMTFAALIGAGFHIVYQGFIVPTSETNLSDIDFVSLGLCVGFTFIFSLIGSKLANKMTEFQLNLISGIMLLIIAVTVGVITLVK